MTLREAEILFKDQPAGWLVETPGGGTRFSYADGWNTDIACCFPVNRREHNWDSGLHPFFEHLGPEGWLREQQARVGHVVEEDDLGLLLRYGADCIGAVSVRPPESITFPEIVEATASPGRTVSGIQKKLLVTKDDQTGRFEPAAAEGLAPYIAKFNSERINSLVRNERLSLLWATAMLGKSEVNEFVVSRIPALDETALIVTRFDRRADGTKLRLEDCAQILCKPRGRDYVGKYDAAYEDVADVIQRHSARPAIDLARFYRRLIVFALLGNCDAHLKNFSLLETPDGLRLSPAYDIVNTAIYEGYDQTLALSLDGRKVAFEEADSALLREFGNAIGLPGRAIDQTFTSLKRQVRKAEPIIIPPDAESPDGFVHRFQEIVRNACLRMLET